MSGGVAEGGGERTEKEADTVIKSEEMVFEVKLLDSEKEEFWRERKRAQTLTGRANGRSRSAYLVIA